MAIKLICSKCQGKGKKSSFLGNLLTITCTECKGSGLKKDSRPLDPIVKNDFKIK